MYRSDQGRTELLSVTLEPIVQLFILILLLIIAVALAPALVIGAGAILLSYWVVKILISALVAAVVIVGIATYYMLRSEGGHSHTDARVHEDRAAIDQWNDRARRKLKASPTEKTWLLLISEATQRASSGSLVDFLLDDQGALVQWVPDDDEYVTVVVFPRDEVFRDADREWFLSNDFIADTSDVGMESLYERRFPSNELHKLSALTIDLLRSVFGVRRVEVVRLQVS
ncbi:hypothetical protein QY049_03130 [Bradyrhizobium sp. WYCCWR 13022]|uniref:hypothetical protein n=1 Tax=unclassified Bradyrhizobium TaxID=2631580 RepID=UPI00263AC4EA|nr:hypothetical protein [Bradyrhizobium sp. WYCCWR 13022]MDN4982218.1 hypothetical protein [Bradyrhizobium sp. WYCCWR 13022]